MKKTFFIISFYLLFISNASVYAFSVGEDDFDANKKIVATFYVKAIKIAHDGMLSWTSANENGSLTYIVEQYLFDKWIAVAQIEGIGTPVPNSYSVNLVLNAGDNTFRIKQKGYDQISRFSSPINYFSKKIAVNYQVINKNQVVEFSNTTYFIIYNPFGVIVKQGYGNSVDISDYTKGYYCLIYDNKLGGFEKKKVAFKNTRFAFILNTPKKFITFKKKKVARNEYSRYRID